MVTVPSAGTSPVQVRSGLAKATVPALAAASLLYVASSSTPPSGSVKLAPGVRAGPELAIVTV